MGAGRLVHLFLTLARALAAGLVLTACNGLFYFPYRGVYAMPEGPHREVRIPTEDGLELHGLLLVPEGEHRGTIVQFHGNAGNVTSHFLALEWVTAHGLALLAFDYRGYGQSPGKPSRAGLDRDARAAIRFARSLPHGSWEDDLVLMGQSLGGAVLLSAYGRSTPGERARVRAVVVEGTFHSYTEVAASVVWQTGLFLPLAGLGYTLVSDEYSPSPFIANIAPTPLLVAHGTADRVVPPGFGRAVFALARAPRELWLVPGARHLGVFADEVQQRRLIAYLSGL